MELSPWAGIGSGLCGHGGPHPSAPATPVCLAGRLKEALLAFPEPNPPPSPVGLANLSRSLSNIDKQQRASVLGEKNENDRVGQAMAFQGWAYSLWRIPEGVSPVGLSG